MNSFSYFPTLVYRDEKPEWLYALKKYVSEYSGEVLEQGSFIQTADISGAPELSTFKKYLLEQSTKILSEQGYAVEKYTLKVSVWAQDVYKGDKTNVHTHKNSQLCGWMFLDTPPANSSYPVYHDPRVRKSMVELESAHSSDVTESTGSIHFSGICPGTVLISSSWLEHELTENRNELPTTCLHFIVSGEIK